MGRKIRVLREVSDRLEVTHIDLATEGAQEVAFFQPIHDRALDLAEVKPDACLAKPLIDGLEALEGTGVNVVDGRALKDHMPEMQPLSHQCVDSVFEDAGVCEVEALVDSEAGEMPPAESNGIAYLKVPINAL